MIATMAEKPTITHSREALEAAKRKLEGERGARAGIAQRLALAEACFRLAVMPGTDPGVAIELTRQAISCDPYHPKLFFHLGRLLHNDGDPQSAVFEYRRALRLAPRNHRIHVHLGLALAELSEDEQKLGLGVLEAVQAGEDAHLVKIVAELDRLIAKRVGIKSKEGSPQPDTPPKPTDKPGSGNQCRWQGIWKLFLLNELASPKPASKKADSQMDKGKRLIDGQRGVSEYAVACLFFLLDNPKTHRQVEGLLDGSLAKHADRPAVRLARAACKLGEARNAEEFVQLASARLVDSELPPELVCCLHYSWYGTSSNIEPVLAVELLDRYPEPFSSLACFRELRLAILDHHARLAWTGDRADRAEILWQYTIQIDPFRIPVAHNLAIAATRTKAGEKYGSAWERATELRYLLAASSGDVRVELEDRCKLHRSFAQQSRLRYVPEAGHKQDGPTAQQLQAWMQDLDALKIWLREGELLYLNTRIKFHSIVHFLGIARTCSDVDAESARSTLMRQFEICFRGRNWAGKQAFLDQVQQMAEKACAEAKDPVARKRDPYFEAEAAEANELAEEAIGRGFLMFDMVRLASASSSPELKRAGLEVSRFLLTMPWRALEPLCKQKGLVAEDNELFAIFLSYVGGLVLASGSGETKDSAAKLEAVDDCIQAVPDAPRLRLIRCQLLLQEKRNREAYETALLALAMTAKLADRAEAAQFEKQFVICLDNAAFGEIPERLLSPSRADRPALIQEGRRVLAGFSKAGGVRLFLAKFLIQTADEDRTRLDEAKKLLEEGLDLFLTDEQLQEAQRLLDQAGTHSKSMDAVQKIRSLLESASARTRAAAAAMREERTPAKTRHVRQEIEDALHEASQAEEIANGAGLSAAVEQARELATYLRKLLEDVEKG